MKNKQFVGLNDSELMQVSGGQTILVRPLPIEWAYKISKVIRSFF